MTAIRRPRIVVGRVADDKTIHGRGIIRVYIMVRISIMMTTMRIEKNTSWKSWLFEYTRLLLTMIDYVYKRRIPRFHINSRWFFVTTTYGQYCDALTTNFSCYVSTNLRWNLNNSFTDFFIQNFGCVYLFSQFDTHLFRQNMIVLMKVSLIYFRLLGNARCLSIKLFSSSLPPRLTRRKPRRKT